MQVSASRILQGRVLCERLLEEGIIDLYTIPTSSTQYSYSYIYLTICPSAEHQ